MNTRIKKITAVMLISIFLLSVQSCVDNAPFNQIPLPSDNPSDEPVIAEQQIVLNVNPHEPSELVVTPILPGEMGTIYELFEFGNVSILFPDHWIMKKQNSADDYVNSVTFREKDIDETITHTSATLWVRHTSDDNDIIKTAQSWVDDAAMLNTNYLSHEVLMIDGFEVAKITQQRPNIPPKFLPFYLTQIFIRYDGNTEYYFGIMYDRNNPADVEIASTIMNSLKIK